MFWGARHKDTVGSLNNLGMVLADQGDYAGARPLMEEAVEIRRQVLGDDHPDTATVLFNLSLVRRDQGDYLAARPGFEKALATWRRALGADHPHTTAVLRQLGRFHWEFGDYAAALPILEEALAAQRRIVGSIQTGEGTLSTGAPSIAECLGLLAQVHLDAGDYSAARPLMEEALEIDRRVLGSDNARTAVSLAELGRFYAAQSDSAAAVPFCEEALAIFRRTRGNDDRNRCSTLSLLGTLYLDMGEYTAARSLFEEAIAISRRSRPESYMMANDLNNLGAWHNKRGNYDEARLLLEEALALYRRVLGTDHRLTVIALSNLATTQVATGEDRAALTTLEKSLRMQGRMIPRMLEVGSERQRIAYLEGMHGVLDFFLSLVRSRFSSDPDAVRSALDRVLRRKGLLAEAQHAQRDEILGKRHPHLREQLSQLTAVRMQAARKHLAGPGPEGIEQHQRLVADWDEKREELERALVREIPEMNLGRRLDAVDHQAIAMALPEESALVEFVRFRVVDLEAIPLPPKLQSKPERYVAFLVRAGQPDAVEMVDLGEAAPIDALVATFRLAMTGDTGGGVTPTDTGAGAVHIEAQLRKALVDPILVQCPDLRAAGRNSGPRPLILAPDGELTQLPFEVLLFEDGHRLIDDYQMSYLSTGRDLLRANDLGGQPGAPIIAGDPQFDLGTAASERDTASAATRLSRDLDRGIRLAPLPGTREEATAIAVQLGVDPWLQHTVLEAELKAQRSPSILHLATHGVFVEDQPSSPSMWTCSIGEDMGRLTPSQLENPMLRSMVCLAGAQTFLDGGTLPEAAEDGLLTAEDVAGMDLTDTELVVLSACDTGRGTVKVGEGVFGLRRAFAIAGVRTLVMSLWKVPDDSTRLLMVHFYEGLCSGQPRGEALRTAQRQVRDRYPDPYYWGAFILQGDAARPLHLPA